MDKTYEPQQLESQWYQFWEQKGYFVPRDRGQSKDKNKSYCIMIPPPNVTGSLHMGHAFQQTLMDVLIRYHRMKGDKTLWLVGTDHAGIATQMVVERQLLAEGQSRHALGREAFVKKVWEWKEQSGDNITRQLRRIGASVDWTRERFTLDEGLSAAVQDVFIRLYNEGLIYRGKRLVNWDPVLLTAVSDLEVESQEEQGHLWYIRYPIGTASRSVKDCDNKDSDHNDHRDHTKSNFIVVATTRPETMLGDVAVAVHPEDERYKHLIGQSLRLPLTDRVIPIIADFEVKPEFGTGCVKITPAHDFNDYAMGERHHLEKINIFTKDAKLNEEVPVAYRGLDRFEARKKIISDLKVLNLIEKIEPHLLNVPRGDRSGAILEPLLTDQWFVKIESLAIPAIKAVEQGDIKFIPENWSKTYFEWMRNIQDWCISRQLWWGHRIPAWYDENGNIYVGTSEADIRSQHKLPSALKLRQDEDVLDTWFSSALWPFSTLGWPKKTEDYKTFYPTQVLVTGFDIIFFWVARMIMFGLKFTDQIPFQEVYIHGLIQDQNGQKMSKTKGNVLDPLDIIDGIDLESLVKKRTSGLMQPQLAAEIEKKTRAEFPKGIPAFGTDALRFTYCALATTGRHIRFDFKRIEGYRHFCNKLWNAARYVLMNTEGKDNRIDPENKELRFKEVVLGNLSIADRWILSIWQKTKKTVEEHLSQYRFDLASQALYEFTWNEYCDWYLELVKPVLLFQTQPDSFSQDLNDAFGSQHHQQLITPYQQIATRHTLISILEELLRCLHPLIPYITEEIWQRMRSVTGKGANGKDAAGTEDKTIMLESYPEANEQCIDDNAEADINWIKAMILGIRNIRGEMNISPGKPLPVLLQEGVTIMEGDKLNNKERSQDKDKNKDRVAKYKPLLQALGKMASLEWLNQDESRPLAATALVGSLELLVPMSDLIDKKAEMARLEKELEKLRKEKEKIDIKLSNPSFVANAPVEVVAQERQRLVDLQLAIEKLSERYHALGPFPMIGAKV